MNLIIVIKMKNLNYYPKKKVSQKGLKSEEEKTKDSRKNLPISKG